MTTTSNIYNIVSFGATQSIEDFCIVGTPPRGAQDVVLLRRRGHGGRPCFAPPPWGA